MSLQALTRRFARLTTDIVVRWPRLWFLLRPVLRFQFDRLAPQWDAIRDPETAYTPYEAALERVEPPPKRALDLGTGTGGAAFALARRFPNAEVVGADVAERMIEQARGNLPDDLGDRVRFEVADASKLPYGDASFDLIGLSNMIPFFDEVARVIGPGGHAVFVFVHGAATPIYVPPERLRAGLEHGFSDVAELAAGAGTALVARRR